MRFTVIYPNNPEARNAIFGKLLELSTQTNLSEREINSPHFKVMPKWPDKETLNSIPLNLQVEEIIIKDGAIINVRKLVVDVEFEKPVEAPVASIVDQPELPFIKE